MWEAQNYAGQDQIRRDAMELLDESQKLLSRTDQALKNIGKQMDRALRKQIKNDSSHLRKLVTRCRLDKVQESDLQEIQSAKTQLENSAASIL